MSVSASLCVCLCVPACETMSLLGLIIFNKWRLYVHLFVCLCTYDRGVFSYKKHVFTKRCYAVEASLLTYFMPACVCVFVRVFVCARTEFFLSSLSQPHSAELQEQLLSCLSSEGPSHLDLWDKKVCLSTNHPNSEPDPVHSLPSDSFILSLELFRTVVLNMSFVLPHQDSGRWSLSPGEDLSSGVYSGNSQSESQSFSMELLGTSTLRPPFCYGGELFTG